jgi:tetratricopeptide (TPR) repeat protein
MGNGTRQAALEYCLGTLATNQGAGDPAAAHLTTCLSLARAQNLREHIVSALAALADLWLRLGNPEAAAGALDEAEQLALEMTANDQLPEIYRLAALLQLGRGDTEASEASARHALTLASELGDPLAIGMSLRVLGQALAAQGRRDDADAAFAHSLEQLAELNQYETARTRACWGTARTTEQNAAQTLLETARAVFDQLGAQRDLDEVAAALAGFQASAGKA